ncbi:TonB-dependent receptor domain-containing protein [Salegentibacter salegens]|uniref:Outer membrane receptor proteins, mostly Fe transport n=1 Tax=Salegentibacter salegens TaxID=143223 RepID=A0A1M7LGS5_9FLAO|nr:TonB-dependent receptor [Salegentibacter salegens]PRX50662.1 outer membrane receptor protein involved in Fe transport [Salegentibacter salegens]SHM77366.1 Outer membrane receptor proteins, mostly Fe transport [Salegentibacter salegens]
MTTKILSTLSAAFFLFFSFNGFAQSGPHKISGKVMDEEMNAPLEFATVSVVNANEPADVTGVVTNSQGNFSIEVPEGTYNVIVEFISYETKKFNDRYVDSDLNLGTITLGLDSDSLDEVLVQAETTQVSVQLDKKIYNIGKDLTTAGGTVSDALNNVPSVSVDIEGGISLRGNQNVRILINGKPSAMAGFGDTNVLSQLPAEAIERVEVITSPSARYDAEGTAGILNIILRQKETLGFNGSVNLNLGHPDNAGLSANLNYRTNDFNIFTNIGWRYFDAPQNNFSDTEYLRRFNSDGEIVRPEYDRIREERETERLNRNYNGNFGIEYFLTEQSSLTASIFYRYGEDEDETLNNSDRYIGGNLVEETLRRELQSEEDNSYQISINYQNKFNDEGHELTADFQFENDAEVQNTFINEDYISTNQENPNAFQREEVYTEEDQKEYLIQADYVLPLGEDARFEAGYRGNFENEITDYRLQQEDLATGNLVTNDTLTNIFDYSENVNALYSQYGTKFGKFSFLLGLRLENTQLKGDINSRLSDEELVEAFGFPIQTEFDNNYLGLFPTVNLIYELSSDGGEEENITVGYNRRINRPRGWYINPFPSRSSRTNVFQGNPNLQPAFASAFDIGYLKRWEKLTFTSSVYYQHETDSFERVEENTGQETTDGIDIIRTIPINLATNKRTGAELGILYNPADWLRLNSSFNFFQFETEGEFNGVDYGAKNTSWFARFSSKVTLPGAIDWQTNAFYRGPQENAQTKNEGIFSLDLALSKEILNESVTLSLNVRDLLNSRKRKSFTSTEFFNRESEFQWRQRQINFSVIYRFNQQKREQRRGGDEDFDDPGFEG